MKSKKIKKPEKIEEIIIRGKKMRRAKIGPLANYLLPYCQNDRPCNWNCHIGEDGVETYKLFGRIVYKKAGKYYMEVLELKN